LAARLATWAAAASFSTSEILICWQDMAVSSLARGWAKMLKIKYMLISSWSNSIEGVTQCYI
jgi:hypothetical protein